MDGDVSVIQISYESSAAPLPMPFPRVDSNTDDLEIIDAKKPAPPGLHGAPPAGFVQPPPAGFVQPPPYGMSMPSNQTALSLFNPPPATAPYPVGAPYPTGPGVPNLYPTGMPGTVGVSPYPPPGAPGISPPPPGAPIPLNAASSNFRPVTRCFPRRCWFKFGVIFGSFMVIIALIALVTIIKGYNNRRKQYKL